MADEQRTPPTKIRVTGLQEAQLQHLRRIDQACAAMHYEQGLSESQVAARTEVEIAQLFRSSDLYVAEADYEVAGYLAWRDEQPKIACVFALNVDPAYHRYGVGSRLMREMAERATSHGIEHAVARCWGKQSPWAVRFLDALGFQVLDGELPKRVAEWRDRLDKAGKLAEPGQVVYWRSIDGLGEKIIPGIPRPS